MLLGSSQVNIGLRIYLRDEFSGPARQIRGQMEAIRGETKLYQDSLRSARNMYGGLFAAGATATAGLASAFQVGAKFDFTMRGVAAAAGATNDEFERMTEKANKLGSNSLFAPQEFANTMRELSLAGLDATEVMSSITPIMYLAGGAMEDLKTSSEIATNAMYMFGYNKSKLGDWQYVSDILAQGAVKSQISLRDLGESIKYAGSTAQDMGQTLPDLTAMVMTLGNAGIKGSMAGTAVENLFRYMALGLGQYAKTGRAQVWEKIGLDPKSLTDMYGNLKPMPDILEALGRATKDLGDVDKQNVLYEIFGVRGKRAASKLLGGSDEYRKHIMELKNSQGVASSLYGKQYESAQGAILAMAGAWKALMDEFSKTLAPVVIPLLQGLNWLLQGLRAFIATPIGSWLTIAGTGFLLFKTALWGIKFAIGGAALAMNTINTSFQTASAAIRMATVDLLNFKGASSLINVNTMFGGTVTRNVGRTARGTYYAQNATGGTSFISAANAAAMGLNLAPGTRGTMTSPGRGGLLGFMGGRVGGMGMAMAGVGAGLGIYQAATSDSTMGMLGGIGMAAGSGMMLIPGLQGVGMGLMLVSSLLPLLSGATESNTKATKDNTESNQELLSGQDKLRLAFMANIDGQGQSGYIRRLFKYNVGENNAVDYILKNNLESYKQSPGSWGSGRPYYDWSNPGRLDIYIDGQLSKKAISVETNHIINKSLQFE